MERLTKEQLKACLPGAKPENIDKFIEPINTTFEKYEIDTPLRRAAFLAQIAHESGSLRYVKELATGEAYEGRKDLGNTEPGDGVRFKGRGLIQITGRANYAQLSKDLIFDFIKEPEKLELPGAATMSAGWFWDLRKLNLLADLGTQEAFEKNNQTCQRRLKWPCRQKKTLCPLFKRSYLSGFFSLPPVIFFV